MKVTKKAIREFLKNQLSTNEAWAKHALLRIYEHQTMYEKETKETRVYNFVGFTGADATILTSFTEQLKSRGYLSPKQMSVLYHKIPKYWNQIWNLADQDKIINMISAR